MVVINIPNFPLSSYLNKCTFWSSEKYRRYDSNIMFMVFNFTAKFDGLHVVIRSIVGNCSPIGRDMNPKSAFKGVVISLTVGAKSSSMAVDSTRQWLSDNRPIFLMSRPRLIEWLFSLEWNVQSVLSKISKMVIAISTICNRHGIIMIMVSLTL